MQYTTLVSAALAVLPAVQAGSAFVYNTCDFDVNVWSVSTDGSSDAITIKAGDKYEESYYKPNNGGGVSIKLMNNTETTGPSGPISQFEYTLSDTVWYDMSNVDCGGEACPFAKHGWYIDASDDSCPVKKCAADLLTCVDAYVLFNDDWNTCMCGADKDISLYLCSSEKPSSNEESTILPITQAQVSQPAESNESSAETESTPSTEPAAKTESSSSDGTLLTFEMIENGVPAKKRVARRHQRHPHARPALL